MDAGNSAEPCHCKKVQEELVDQLFSFILVPFSTPVTNTMTKATYKLKHLGLEVLMASPWPLWKSECQQASRHETVEVAESLYLTHKLKIEKASQEWHGLVKCQSLPSVTYLFQQAQTSSSLTNSLTN